LEAGVAERPARADRFLHHAHQAGMPLEEPGPSLVPMPIVEHRPAPRRKVCGRDQAGDVRPVLEQHAAAVDEPLERHTIEGTEAAPQRQVMGAIDDVDRVELDSACVLGEASEARSGQPTRTRPIQLLTLQEERSDGAEGEDRRAHLGSARSYYKRGQR
jgi:hypothetical protein